MAISTAAKASLGGLGTVAVGGPTVYVVYDKYFSDSLYEVEKEVINKDLKLTVSGPSNDTPKKITITAVTNGTTQLTSGHSWKCEITIDSAITTPASNLQSKLQDNLFKENDDNNKPTRLKNKELLVRACHKEQSTETKKFVGGLTLKQEAKQGGTKSYFFENHLELKPLLAGVTVA